MTPEVKSLDAAEQVLSMERGRIDIVGIAGGGVGRATFEPGWRWLQHEKPAVGASGDFCELPHVVYMVEGQLHIVMRDGGEFDLKAGDVAVLPAGHDGWVVGDQRAVMLDVAGIAKA